MINIKVLGNNDCSSVIKKRYIRYPCSSTAQARSEKWILMRGRPSFIKQPHRKLKQTVRGIWNYSCFSCHRMLVQNFRDDFIWTKSFINRFVKVWWTFQYNYLEVFNTCVCRMIFYNKLLIAVFRIEKIQLFN